VIQLAFLRIYRKYLLWLSSLAHIGFNFSRIRCWPSMSETYSSFVGFTFIFFGVFLFFFGFSNICWALHCHDLAYLQRER